MSLLLESCREAMVKTDGWETLGVTNVRNQEERTTALNPATILRDIHTGEITLKIH